MREEIRNSEILAKFRMSGTEKLECSNVFSRMVEHVKENSGWSYNEHKMVCRVRIRILNQNNKSLTLLETALVREYARWCGGTVASATSYPIRTDKPKISIILIFILPSLPEERYIYEPIIQKIAALLILYLAFAPEERYIYRTDNPKIAALRRSAILL